MASLDEAIVYILKIEGDEWDLAPNDSGAWTGGRIGVGVNIGTKLGITAPDLSKRLGRTATKGDMQNLTVSQIGSFMDPECWTPIRGNELKNQGDANRFAELANNGGLETAILEEQLAMGIPQTGIMDDTTLAALNSMG